MTQRDSGFVARQWEGRRKLVTSVTLCKTFEKNVTALT